ncbi:hypothetical protein DLH72_01315, partial [Candidatus Gracilibacteria bacterium]
MKKTIGIFEESKGYGFVIPTSRKEHKGDFYINQKNFFGAKNGDLVEIEILDTNRGKSKEAKIIKIIGKDSSSLEKNFEGLEKIVGVYSQNKEGFGFVDL